MKGKKKTIGLVIYFILLLMPIYWMFSMSSQVQRRHPCVLCPVPERPHIHELHEDIYRFILVHGLC